MRRASGGPPTKRGNMWARERRQAALGAQCLSHTAARGGARALNEKLSTERGERRRLCGRGGGGVSLYNGESSSGRLITLQAYARLSPHNCIA